MLGELSVDDLLDRPPIHPELNRIIVGTSQNCSCSVDVSVGFSSAESAAEELSTPVAEIYVGAARALLACIGGVHICHRDAGRFREGGEFCPDGRSRGFTQEMVHARAHSAAAKVEFLDYDRSNIAPGQLVQDPVDLVHYVFPNAARQRSVTP